SRRLRPGREAAHRPAGPDRRGGRERSAGRDRAGGHRRAPPRGGRVLLGSLTVVTTPPAIRRLTEDDWAALRATRLAALAEAPYAFASTLQREQGFTEQVWRSRLGPRGIAAYFGADDPGQDRPAPLAGLAALLRPDGADLRHWHLVSMWVSPAARGQGLA